MHCLFCDHDLAAPGTRAAYDPWLGRLWRICPACARWNVVPLEDRWDALEAYEREVRDRGRSRLRTEHLDLVAVPDGELVRVGRAPRPELAGWRYGDALPAPALRGPLAWLRRLLVGLPSAPLGYDAGYGAALRDPTLSRRWFASPFLDHAPTLTTAFLHVPLATACPACGGPLAVMPWSFQAVRLSGGPGAPTLLTTCGVCGEPVEVPVREARAALRLGLGIVNRTLRDVELVESAARLIGGAGGPAGWLGALAREEAAVGELDPPERLALGVALDEEVEAELLEAEWREAEELAAIMDRTLTPVAGFEEFRRRVTGRADDGDADDGDAAQGDAPR